VTSRLNHRTHRDHSRPPRETQENYKNKPGAIPEGVHPCTKRSSFQRALEREPRAKLANPVIGRPAAVEDLTQVRVDASAGTCKAVTIEGIEHVIANVQFEATVAEGEVFVDSDVLGR
jgi:hypothetical protein